MKKDEYFFERWREKGRRELTLPTVELIANLGMIVSDRGRSRKQRERKETTLD